MGSKKETQGLPLSGRREITFAEFYHTYRALCFSYALGSTGDSDRANDVVQESFVAIYKQITEKGLRFESVRHARDYLLKTVRNVACDSTAAEARKVRLEEILHPLINDRNQEALYVEEEKLRALRRSMKRLHPKYREVLRLRFHERMTLAAIAQHLGKSIATIQYTEKKALEELRKNKMLREFFHKNGT